MHNLKTESLCLLCVAAVGTSQSSFSCVLAAEIQVATISLMSCTSARTQASVPWVAQAAHLAITLQLNAGTLKFCYHSDTR